MNRLLLSILLSIITLTSCSQDFTVFKFVERNPHFPDHIYTFPLLQASNKMVADKVNYFLIKDQLDIQYGQEETSIFENVWQLPNNPVARINFLNYHVDLLNGILYTVTISGEFCSAYCEGYDVSYTFDLTTGSLLTLDTLFNKSGQQRLLKQLIDHKSELIKQKIQELQLITKSDTLAPDKKEHYREMIDMYRNCNSDYADLKNFRFITGKDSIEIIYGRCSVHYNRSMDELWYFNKKIMIDEWSEYLSEIGKEKLIN